MYKIPSDYDISVLTGDTINQIAFGSNFITLFFEKGYLQFSGGFSFSVSGATVSYEEVYPVRDDFGLLRILEKEIYDVSIFSNREGFSIKFDGGIVLCVTSNEMYESFTLNIDGKEVRV